MPQPIMPNQMQSYTHEDLMNLRAPNTSGIDMKAVAQALTNVPQSGATQTAGLLPDAVGRTTKQALEQQGQRNKTAMDTVGQALQQDQQLWARAQESFKTYLSSRNQLLEEKMADVKAGLLRAQTAGAWQSAKNAAIEGERLSMLVDNIRAQDAIKIDLGNGQEVSASVYGALPEHVRLAFAMQTGQDPTKHSADLYKQKVAGELSLQEASIKAAATAAGQGKNAFTFSGGGTVFGEAALQAQAQKAAGWPEDLISRTLGVNFAKLQETFAKESAKILKDITKTPQQQQKDIEELEKGLYRAIPGFGSLTPEKQNIIRNYVAKGEGNGNQPLSSRLVNDIAGKVTDFYTSDAPNTGSK